MVPTLWGSAREYLQDAATSGAGAGSSTLSKSVLLRLARDGGCVCTVSGDVQDYPGDFTAAGDGGGEETITKARRRPPSPSRGKACFKLQTSQDCWTGIGCEQHGARDHRRMARTTLRKPSMISITLSLWTPSVCLRTTTILAGIILTAFTHEFLFSIPCAVHANGSHTRSVASSQTLYPEQTMSTTPYTISNSNSIACGTHLGMNVLQTAWCIMTLPQIPGVLDVKTVARRSAFPWFTLRTGTSHCDDRSTLGVFPSPRSAIRTLPAPRPLSQRHTPPSSPRRQAQALSSPAIRRLPLGHHSTLVRVRHAPQSGRRPSLLQRCITAEISDAHPMHALYTLQTHVLLGTYFSARRTSPRRRFKRTARRVSRSACSGVPVLFDVLAAPPADPIAEGERIRGFWAAVFLQSSLHLVLNPCGGAGGILDELGAEIDAPWPLEIADYEAGVLPPDYVGQESVRHLFMVDLFPPSPTWGGILYSHGPQTEQRVYGRQTCSTVEGGYPYRLLQDAD
ncbi:hypothetical protein DFH09DRAFT_1081984 [Mycena vulgaris]|nr:hypothetical protein DFH09DRAFT_1081984 [Mycena vulgaris]